MLAVVSASVKFAVPRLGRDILDRPFVRTMDFDGITILIPIMNEEGRAWYSESPIENYDFIVERNFGLLDNAKIVYDFGGH